MKKMTTTIHSVQFRALFFCSALLFTSVIQVVADCQLQCRNGGMCDFGSAEHGFASQDSTNGDPTKLANGNRDYCKCPEGWTGLQCEIKYVVCDENQHTCLNGAPCEETADGDGNLYYHCECDAANSDLSSSYARHFCEHAATVSCNNTIDTATGQPDKASFCTNGGRCNDIVTMTQSHQGCNCGDDWEGPHCQFSKKKSEALSQEQASAKHAIIRREAFIFAAIALGGIIVLIACILSYHRCLGRQRNESSRVSLRCFEDALGDSGRGFHQDEEHAEMTAPSFRSGNSQFDQQEML